MHTYAHASVAYVSIKQYIPACMYTHMFMSAMRKYIWIRSGFRRFRSQVAGVEMKRIGFRIPRGA